MGSWKSWEEDYPSTILQSETQAELSVSGLNLRTHLSESKTDQERALVARFQTNLILKENDTQNSEEKEKYGDTSEGNSGNGTKHQYALRPYAEDCPFFLKTGMCKFGSHCKFNHPARVGGIRMNEKGGVVEQNGQIECKFYLTQQGCKYGKACKFVHYKEKSDVGPLELNSFGLAMQLGVEEKERGTSGEEIGQIECKYYLTPGGCKYGEACKYNHSKEKSSTCIDKSEIPPPELNFLGLPIRVLEKECPFYMRTGSCAYGVDCRFHHPEPTADEGSNTFNSAPVGASMLGHCRGNQHGKLDSTGQTVESWSSGVRLDKTNSYFDNHLADLPEMLHSSQWRGYQDSIFAQERTRHFPPVPVIDNQGRTAAASRVHQQQTQEEFPERPGEPECAYYMKTGDCKYRSSCKFHHPKSHAPKSPLCVLSKTGLPLRPGRKICRHYEKHGICKFGQGCMFDHPEGHVSPAFPLVSVAEYPSETNPATFPVPEVAGCGNGSETPTQLSV